LATSSSVPPARSFDDKHHFLLRKLHSLSGVIPVGVFLIEHLVTNSMSYFGPAKYNKSVQFIADLPFLIFLEIFGIFLPLAFHALYGIKIAMTSQGNAAQYPFMANQRFSLQRITGYIAFVFIIVHLAKFRFSHWFGFTKEHFLNNPDYFKTTYEGLMNWHPWGVHVPASLVIGFYVLGLAASCFHFANGLWTFCISWGITVGSQAQRKFGYMATVIGVTLFVLGTLSLYGFKKHEEKVKGEESTQPGVGHTNVE